MNGQMQKIQRLCNISLPMFLLLMFGVNEREVHAQSNYRDVPLGGRTATMGGVGTASGNDSAMPYLNPAGVSAVPGDVFALSAQVYAWSQRKVDTFFAPAGYGDLSVSNPSDSFTSTKILSLPSSIMYLKHLSAPDAKLRHVVAMSLVSPNQQTFTMSGNSNVLVPSVNGGITQTKNIEYNSSDLYTGPTYSLAIGDRLNAGITGYVLYGSNARTTTETFFQYVFNGARTTESVQTTSLNRQTVSLVPIIGLQGKIFDGLRAGLAVAIPSIPLFGKQTIQQQYSIQSAGSTKQITTLDSKGFDNRPTRINAGVSYERKQFFAIGADAHLYLPRKKATGWEGTSKIVQSQTDSVTREYFKDSNTSHDANTVIDISVGGEFWPLSWLAVRGGFFTNNAPFKKGTSLNDMNNIEMDRLGGTLGLGFLAGSFETTVGAVFQHGSGKINILDITSDAQKSALGRAVGVDISENAIMFVLSAVVTSEEAKAKMSKQLDGVGPKLPGPQTPGGGSAPDCSQCGSSAPPPSPTPPASIPPAGTSAPTGGNQ